MQRSIRLSLSLGGAAALALASTPFLPAAAQDAGTAEDLGGVLSISLQDVVNPPLASRELCKVQAPPTKQASAGSFPSQLVTTAFGTSMSSSTLTSGTAMAKAASSTPMWLVASPHPHALATAG